MSNNQIEHHLRKALVSTTRLLKSQHDTIVLASAMTSVYKIAAHHFLLALVAIAVYVTSTYRYCRFCTWRELLLESDVEKFNT